jgi:AcrR family transcriptional regulator
MAGFAVKLELNSNLYLRDPQSSKLGQRIVQHSILLIDEIGFEQFNFKKLAARIESTEASVYRYFENKHSLLVYLLNWYWEWMKFRIDFNTMNIENPWRRLEKAIRVIVDTAQRNTSIGHVDEDILQRIVVVEGPKAYHTKAVDKENSEGFFLSYKSLSEKIAHIIQEIDPNYPYPLALASSLLENGNNNLYFAKHLPRLTDIQYSEDYNEDVIQMLTFMAFRQLQPGTTPGKGSNQDLTSGKLHRNGNGQ